MRFGSISNRQSLGLVATGYSASACNLPNDSALITVFARIILQM